VGGEGAACYAGKAMAHQSFVSRPLEPRDHPYVWDLNQSEAPHIAAERFEELVRICELSASRWVIEAGEERAGFLLGMTPDAPYDSPNFAWFQERYERFLYVDRLAVGTAYRRRGVGAALYACADADARRLDLPMVCCEVNLRPPNPVSLAFHERLGFEAAGEQESEGKRVRLLIKRLA
jgi:uncharacterized protein